VGARDGALVFDDYAHHPTEIEATLHAARLARELGKLVVWNPALAPAHGVPEELVQLADVVVPNESEAALLTGQPVEEENQVRRAAATLLGRGVGAVVMTLGGRGALLAHPGGVNRIAPVPVDVVDTTGAGDAFCGALAVGLGAQMPLLDAARLANMAGAVAVTRPGAVPSMPHCDDIWALCDRLGGLPDSPLWRAHQPHSTAA
jgi:ribokinase